MTPRMVAAVRNPLVDILGHCTGRLFGGRGRPQREFDAEVVFTACRTNGKAVEINSAPNGTIDPATCSPWPWTSGACSPSTPTRTLLGSSTGSAAAAHGRKRQASRRTG